MTQAAPLELTFLGSGNAFVGDRYWSSFILNGRYLFDAPPTLLPHLHKLGIPTLDIAAVFISALPRRPLLRPALPLPGLRARERARAEDLVIVGPPGTQKVIEEMSQLGFRA